MSDTKFIEQIDGMLKGHYGKDFEWDTLFVSNFNKGGIGYIGVNCTTENNTRSSNWTEFTNAKLEAREVKNG